MGVVEVEASSFDWNPWANALLVAKRKKQHTHDRRIGSSSLCLEVLICFFADCRIGLSAASWVRMVLSHHQYPNGSIVLSIGQLLYEGMLVAALLGKLSLLWCH